MTQPFRNGSSYESVHWKGLGLQLLEDRIEVSCPEPLHALSSAVHPGGFSQTDRIVNWKVPLTYQCGDPVSDLVRQCKEWGCDPQRTVGLITAAKLTHASVVEVQGDKFNLLCCTTAGTRNAARAGLPRHTYPAYTPGTINTIILIDGQMTDSAMVNAVITATEAKTAALQQLGIVEKASGEPATGTTTDAVVIGVSQRLSWNAVHAYAGAATSIGCKIGEAVYASIHEATRTQQED
ncbi:adenosylcobinamide amidohydrolase [Paenibacillus alkaliterrae]|uniref:adenosylcobinamide amidohydrolase n=1 Tax=Paenibacillus alkaliterrae TaxID=320909 RepID=UPI001F262E21|nr:adenosylcobinamide amidohydrolase [Paenibacillus alkaliterrae]MCF2937119.1 adenosylcobinamide amidohydrolase [Paenibacillus alkaliterrae]